MAHSPKLGITEVKRVGKFGIVGVINTALDFTIFNVLIHWLHLTPVPANLVSTTCAMVFSFVANKRVVFQRDSGSVVKQAVTFYLVTAFGLYVIQTGTIHLLTEVWTGPVQLAVAVAHATGLSHYLSDATITSNTAKIIGTVFSLAWNYICYKKVVFI
ncbi:MAG TPA: GtrA family protein [Candidatus Saccharimonadia bacterium]